LCICRVNIKCTGCLFNTYTTDKTLKLGIQMTYRHPALNCCLADLFGRTSLIFAALFRSFYCHSYTFFFVIMLIQNRRNGFFCLFVKTATLSPFKRISNSFDIEYTVTRRKNSNVNNHYLFQLYNI